MMDLYRYIDKDHFYRVHDLTDLHNWDTIEELVEREEKLGMFPPNPSNQVRYTYARTGRWGYTFVNVKQRKGVLVRDHVRPCV